VHFSTEIWCTFHLIFTPPLPASYFKKEAESSPLIEVTIPAFIGPDQDKPWVGVLRKLAEVGYY